MVNEKKFNPIFDLNKQFLFLFKRLEWCEQKFYDENIKRISRISKASENVRDMCSQKKYLEAAQLVSECTMLLESDFVDVKGLQDVKRQIDSERMKLEVHMFQEMTNQLHLDVRKSVLENVDNNQIQLHERYSSFRQKIVSQVNKTQKISISNSDDNNETTNEFNFSNENNSSSSNFALSSLSIIESLVTAATKLNNPETNSNIVEKLINDINHDMNRQLIQTIITTSNHVLESNLVDSTRFGYHHLSSGRGRQNLENNPKLLAQLIYLSFEQFKMTAKIYRQFVDYAAKINRTNYNTGYVWTCIQGVLIQLLEEYLDIRQNNQQMLSNNIQEPSLDKIDINSFFFRKRFNFGLFPGGGGGDNQGNLLGYSHNNASQASMGVINQQQTPQQQQLQTNQQELGGGSGSFASGLNQTDNDQHQRLFTFKGSSNSMSIDKYLKEKNNESFFNKDNENNSKDVPSQNDDDNTTNNNILSKNSISSYNDEHRIFKILVCQPGHRNITSIFATMEQIIKEILDEIRNISKNSNNNKKIQQQQQQTRLEITLDKFLQDFIRKTFITNAVESIRENARIHNTMPVFTYQSDINELLITLNKQQELALQRPILQNILLVYDSCMDLFHLINDMNSYAVEFFRAMLSLIKKHTDYCKHLFLTIVSSENNRTPEEQRKHQQQQQQQQNVISISVPKTESYVYSMTWIQDEGINQYFKQLPSFSSASKNKPSPAAILFAASSNDATTTTAAASSASISSTLKNFTNNSMIGGIIQSSALLAANVEVEQFDIDVSSKEVDTLIGNLNERPEEHQNFQIIVNLAHIEMIAHLHESTDWLIVQLKYILNSLEKMVRNPTSLSSSLSPNELNQLSSLIDDLERWRGDTLLILFLETRIHCFFYLLKFISKENNKSYEKDVDTDPEESILIMNENLFKIHEHLMRSLQKSKVNYIFDGLGFMIATILIKSIKNFRKFSVHGIAKMCRNIFHIEQTLSAIRTKADPHLMKVIINFKLIQDSISNFIYFNF
jgi:hypothetical protein